MSDDRDILLAAFGFGFGVWSFFLGFKRFRRKRRIENIPTSTVRGLALGVVELVGKAKKCGRVTAPLTKKECIYYRYTIERYEKRGKSSRWVTIAQGDSRDSLFCLDDATGTIVVFPKGAEVILPKDYEFTTGWGRSLPNNLIQFLEGRSLSCKGLFGQRTLRFREWHICEDETIYVLGTAQKQGDSLGNHQKELVNRLRRLKDDPQKMLEIDVDKDGEISAIEWDRAVADVERELLEKDPVPGSVNNSSDLMVAQGEMETLFIISDHSEKELVKKLTAQACLGVFGGAALSLVCLAYLLFRLKDFLF